ncbi:MAG: tetratricopeptide repeat protein [Chromatiaceae bacterium]|nr:tetratricopeptide repeat protein [Chromatiaceae bacterium]
MGAMDLPKHNIQELSALLNARQYEVLLKQVVGLVEQYPASSFLFKALGIAKLNLDQPRDAISALKEAESIRPGDPGVIHHLGMAYYRSGQLAEGILELERIIEKNPSNTIALCTVGKMLIDSGKFEHALEYADKASKNGDMERGVLLIRAEAYYKLQRLTEALANYQQIAEKFPDDLGSQLNLANTLRMLGQFSEAEAIYRAVLDRDPKRMSAFSNYFYAKHYNPVYTTPASFWSEIKDWDSRFAPSDVRRHAASDCNPHRCLRLGFLSKGFRLHPVGSMITSALEALSRTEFKLIAYSLSYVDDRLTRRLKARFDVWHPVSSFKDEELADKIQQDEIDILFDLCGHSDGQRLAVIAREPAPLIVKWVGGLVDTTGPTAINYLLSDAIETPLGADRYYVEKLIRLPNDYICYLPSDDAPAVGPLPAEANGFITLGCFNNPAKINPHVIGYWAQLLHALPESRILLKGAHYADESFAQEVQRQFFVYGIDAARLILEPSSPHQQLLEAYNRVDIALDPWPYSGGLTTCEALLMGVPVVTLPGPTFAGRHSATHLVNAGLPELVADDWETYQRRTPDIASNLMRLNRLKNEL